ncbi:PREDICTED: uncharacterized protein LOC104596076 [Nelumbo nucifera]|uniref:Uncharacterized protein n=2 Tax=Nelumbo nucifera TaxID=4432 RepID=A0A822XBW4_NELNU|nr:PREDICTED: uncharacterized protein LOC104596076 [Nelumbo nucifera]DAD18904.1 TPA_asm: hypothetical protein HUJ06_020367 [Nelumbo nucifera]
MNKKQGKKHGLAPTSGHLGAITIREESSGRKLNKGGSNNAKSILKREHLQKLALWTGGEAAIPSLGAFFGHRLAAWGEAMGTPLESSLFPCQRCESILQPGYNCTVRIEKNRAKLRKQNHKKLNIPTQNNVVYTCKFCSHRNLKRGTPKGYMKEICASKPKPASKLKPGSSNQKVVTSKSMEKRGAIKMLDEINSSKTKSILESNSNGPTTLSETMGEVSQENSPPTPLVGTRTLLLEGKAKRRRQNRAGSNKAIETESNSAAMSAGSVVSAGGSSKRKRRSWCSLKEIAESSERESTQNIANLKIPFFL